MSIEEESDALVIEGKAIELLPIGFFPTLTSKRIIRHLFLSNNKLSYLPEDVANMTTLETIYLNQNEFQIVPLLPVSIRVLVMSNNPLNQSSSLQSLKELPNLEKLTLDVCELTDIANVLHCVELHTLQLHENNIKALPDKMQKLSKLKLLSLHCNRLQELPPSITELENLEWLSLHCNGLRELPKEIGKLKSLQRLSLHCNQLTTLPSSLSKCTNIIALSLFSNKLENIDSDIFSNLLNCKVLALHKNNLSESKVPSKEELPHLKEYYVTDKDKSQNKYLIDDEDTTLRKFMKTRVFTYNVDKLTKATWGIMFPYAIKRLNISEGTEVNIPFLKQQYFVSTVTFEDLCKKNILTDDEYKYASWYWDRKRPKEIHLLKVSVEQDLRRVATKLKHTEIWLMGLFIFETERKHFNCIKLCPLKRDSDFSYDIFEALQR